MKDKLVIRKYQTGDEERILSLFYEVFGIKRSYDRWRWQFQSNAQGKGWIVVAESGGRIVGQFALRRNDLNFLGYKITAGQSCDTMVRLDHRKMDLFRQLAEENYVCAIKDGLKAAFSFPNRESYPGYMRKLGRYRICVLSCYVYRIGFRRLVGRTTDYILKRVLLVVNRIRLSIVKRLINAEVRITRRKGIDDSAGELLRECLKYEVLSIWKDVKYMKWRYENHPDFIYDFHLMYIEGCIEGFIVCRVFSESVTICELVSRKKSLRECVLLIRHVVDYYVTSSAQKIEFVGYDNGFFSAVFRASGFSSYPSNFVFTAQAFDDEKLERMLMIPENWSVVSGDLDIF